MKRNRVLALALSLFLVLSLAACAARPSGGSPTPSPEADTYTTATETKYVQDKVMMERADVEAHMAKLLQGPGDYREMYTLGTSYKNVPLTSSIEFVYAPETIRFYGTSDLGTEKLEQMKRNDSVSLSWVRMLTPGELAAGETYFTISQGVQISGRAVIVDPEDDRFEEIMMLYIPTMGREYTREYSDKLKGVCAVVEIIPEKIVLRDVALKDEGYNYMQVWEAE